MSKRNQAPKSTTLSTITSSSQFADDKKIHNTNTSKTTSSPSAEQPQPATRKTLNPSEKYEYYFDDSSSDEDEQLLKSTELSKMNENIAAIVKINPTFQLSFIAHEVAEHVWKSKEINDQYYEEKIKQFKKGKSQVLDDNDFQDLVDQCAESAYGDWTQVENGNETFGETKDTKAALRAVKKVVLDNKRAFVEYFYHGLQPIVVEFTESMETLVKSFHIPAQNISSTEEISEEDIQERIIHEIEKLNCYKKKHTTTQGTQITEQTRVLCNKNAKNEYALGKTKSNSSFTRKLFTLLEENGTSIKIKRFTRDNIQELRESYDKQTYADLFMEQFSRLVESKLKDDSTQITRSFLSDRFLWEPIDKNYSVINFIVRMRLIARSSSRRLKNGRGFLQKITGSENHSIINVYHFPSSERNFIEHQTFISTSQTRQDKMLNLGSYDDIYKSIENLMELIKSNDAHIASWILKTFQGDKLNPLPDIGVEWTVEKQSDVRAFIGNVTALLFGTEVSRNLSCLIIHPMMLELICEKELTWKDVLTEDMMMPMAADGVVAASRGLRIAYKRHLTLSYRSYSYDYAKNEVLPIIHPDVISLASKEHNIVDMWMRVKSKTTLPKELDTKMVIEKICEAVGIWYDIDITKHFI